MNSVLVVYKYDKVGLLLLAWTHSKYFKIKHVDSLCALGVRYVKTAQLCEMLAPVATLELLHHQTVNAGHR